MQFFFWEKKRNPFDLFGQSLLTYIESWEKAQKEEENFAMLPLPPTARTAHIFEVP